jgi:hypothetical protein
MLSAAPTALITVDWMTADAAATTADNDYAAASGTLTFAPTDPLTQTITILVQGDMTVESDEAFVVELSNATNATIGDAQGTGTILNDDIPAAVIIQPLTLVLSEPTGSATFTVSLANQPMNDVTISLASSDLSECSVPPLVTISNTTWQSGVPITVTVVDDSDVDGSQICTIVTDPASSGDPRYQSLNPNDITVTVNDDDSVAGADILVHARGLSIREPDETTTFTIRLKTQPTSDITIPMSVSDATECWVSPTVIIPAGSWSQGIDVTVMALDDTEVDGPQPCIVYTAPAISVDPNYNGRNANDVHVMVLDNEDPSTTADHARAQAPLCQFIDGSTSPIVRADIPTGTVPGGTLFCRAIIDNGQLRDGENMAEIGIESLTEQNILQAVDVFGLTYGGQSETHFVYPVQVCLQGQGRFFYLDATQAPRTVVELAISTQGNYTCAEIPNAGTVVLVASATTDPSLTHGNTSPLVNCTITTNYLLNLRDAPDGAVIAQVPYHITLTALERQGTWIYVDYLGTYGWLSTLYITEYSSCK